MRNNYRIEGDDVFIEIPTKNGDLYKTIVSKRHLPMLLAYDVKWIIRKCAVRQLFYAQANIKENGKWKSVVLHRLLLGLSHGQKHNRVNHLDGNGLNNRDQNLQIVDYSVCAINKRTLSKPLSGVRGVYYSRGRWKVEFKHHGKHHYFGQYDSLEEASQVAKNSFKKLFNNQEVAYIYEK